MAKANNSVHGSTESKNKENRTVKKEGKTKSSNNRENRGKPRVKPSAAWSETIALEQAHNDPEWYASVPELLTSSASVNFFNPLGGPTHWLDSVNDIAGERVVPVNHLLSTVPGVCAFPFAPVLGVSTDNTSPVNMAARNLYTFIHSVMAVGSSAYDPPDMMLYTMAAASAYMYLAWMRRLYGCINLYTQMNKYLPDALLTAMGVRPSEMRDKMMQLYNYISVYQNKLGSFAIPTSLSYFTRQMWMASNLYIDDPINKGQIYMFNPAYYWKYNEYDGAGKLVQVSASAANMAGIVRLGDSLLSAFVASQDCYTMSGDVLHAFGADGIFKIDVLDPAYVVMPAYVPEVLSQIHNATLAPAMASDFTEITQNTSTGENGGAIICEPKVLMLNPHDSVYYKGNRILSMPQDLPTPADVMVATRLMFFTENIDTGMSAKVTSCGTEILLQPRIYLTQYDPNEGMVITEFQSYPYFQTLSEAMTLSGMTPILFQLSNLSTFNYHPMVMIGSADTGDPDVYPSPVYLDFDVDNYTSVSGQTVDRMHTCALMSMFKVPVMGIFDTKTTK